MIYSSKRLYFRNHEETDLDGVHYYASDDEVVKYAEWGPTTEAETKGFINYAMDGIDDKDRVKYELAIIHKETNELIGGVNLYITSASHREGEVGYILNRKFWGLGYASEAAQAMLEFGFNKLKLHRIKATCDVRNIGSIRVLEKCGLKKEGTIRSHIMLRDGWRDSYLYGILENEFSVGKL